jgi:hypothetical protein
MPDHRRRTPQHASHQNDGYDPVFPVGYKGHNGIRHGISQRDIDEPKESRIYCNKGIKHG